MIEITGNSLKLEECAQVARNQAQICLSDQARAQIQASSQRIDQILGASKPVYGVNTGFGLFADKSIEASDIGLLNRNLIVSHAVGTGTPFPQEIVRAAMVIRVNTLSKGYSGIREEIITTLIEMLNRGVIPVIPSQGSLGSSGDLCQLSHLALVFTRDQNDAEEESGFAEFEGEVLPGKTAMQKAGLNRLILGPKEGLALNNGATFSTAISTLAIIDSQSLIDLSVLALGLTLEAVRSCSNAFDSRIQELRGMPGQSEFARMVRKMIEKSEWVDGSDRVQDSYSLRCSPQVCGAVIDTLEFVKKTIQAELNAATDNPLIFPPAIAISGGNFHGEPIGLAMDYMKIAISELCAISERRIYRLLDQHLNGGLPDMLVGQNTRQGLNSGLMMPHYTAVSLTLENQSLANPDSTRSLPASGSQEDHNANSLTAARHAREVLENTFHVLAIEILTACQAIAIRKESGNNNSLGKGSGVFYEEIRKTVKFRAADHLWIQDIDRIKSIIWSESFLKQLREFLK